MIDGIDRTAGETAPGGRRPYVTPSVERVDLALEETLSAGCKLGGVCDDDYPLDPEAGQAGS